MKNLVKFCLIGLAGITLGGVVAISSAGGLGDAVRQYQQERGGSEPASTKPRPASSTPSSSGRTGSGRWNPAALRVADLPEPATRSFAPKALFETHSRIDPALLALAEPGQFKGFDGLHAMTQVHNRRVAVTLAARQPRDVETLAREVRRLGGEVSARFDNRLNSLVFARLPVDRITSLSNLSGLDYAAPQPLFRPPPLPPMRTSHYRPKGGPVISEGVETTGAKRLHEQGITGKGVKVGILDFGFYRYSELQKQGVLPAPAATQTFSDEPSREVHGTACAEIIHDMAPDAALY
ncbi:MAG: hypothetical protein WCP34_17225, partial [Pseudomonadota bacterium]